MRTWIGKVQLWCNKAKICADCPMPTREWEKLTKPPCCDRIWLPARHLTESKDKNDAIRKPKAMKLFLRELGVL